MRIINRLRRPGEIRSVRLDEEIVRVRLVDDEEIIYRRIRDENVSLQGIPVRCSALPTKL